MAGQAELSERQIAILDYEFSIANRGRFAKDADVRARFGVPSARYHQELFALIDLPAALERDPQLVKCLLRLRDARSKARASRTFRADAA
ncbi:MAG: DUF3263 domain-containing protein [Pseudolysinimonas sp.]